MYMGILREKTLPVRERWDARPLRDGDKEEETKMKEQSLYDLIAKKKKVSRAADLRT